MNKPNAAQEVLNVLKGHMDQLAARNASNPAFGHLGPTFAARCQEWAVRDYWTVEETANLFCGTDPARPHPVAGHDDLNKQIEKTRALLLCAEIKVGGKANKQLLAKDAMGWAKKKRLPLPAQLLAAMGERPTAEDKAPHGNAIKNAEKRQAVLGAAVAALVKYDHQCKDRGEKYTGRQIATVIEQHQAKLFVDHVAPLSIETMAELINKYLPK